MVEWLRPAIPINVINIKVHELEENYNSFFELLDKSLKIHEIVIWLIKQKVNKPRVYIFYNFSLNIKVGCC